MEIFHNVMDLHKQAQKSKLEGLQDDLIKFMITHADDIRKNEMTLNDAIQLCKVIEKMSKEIELNIKYYKSRSTNFVNMVTKSRENY